MFYSIASMFELLLLAFWIVKIRATCYGLDHRPLEGTDAYIYQPCNSIVGSVSMCCATNRTNVPGGAVYNMSNSDQGWDGNPKDTCLPNGLCQNIKTINGVVTYGYWRDFCSSENWEGCLKFDGDELLDPQVRQNGSFVEHY